MSLEVTIHTAQMAILRELLFQQTAGFGELQRPAGLSSDHFAFHIAKLVGLGLVEKVQRGRYQLTARGKEYANKLDTDSNTIERQPKNAVLLGICRNHNGEAHYLLQERLKHPYFGFWGIPTGKIRWGETILQTAARELAEETGLEADLEYVGVYHEQSFQKESGELMEDKIFFLVRCTNPRGELIENFEGGRNRWMSIAEAKACSPRFDSLETELAMLDGDYQFKERITEYSAQQF